MPIASNATIASNVSDLADPEAYIRGALTNVSFSKGKPEVVSYRIGVRGSGRWPNYRIERSDQPHQCFDGRTHKSAFEEDNLRNENWSREAMTTDQLLKLFAIVSPHRAKKP
jgi:hypothetical protein